MARRGSAIAGNRAVGAQTAPSSGSALPPGQGPSPLAQQLAAGLGVNGGGVPGGTMKPGGGWGDAYGGYGYTLPRSPQDFTNGAFGPFSPIVPVAVDPPQGTGFPVPRREEYRVGWNLPVGQPGAEGIKLADFGTLRTLADLYSVARACITFLKSQIAALEWDIAPTTQAAKAMRNDKGAMKDFGERQAEAVRFFRRPDPDYFNWQSWLSAVMEEVLVFDALSIVLRPKWARGLGKGVLWSDLDSLNLISGPTIRPLYDLNGATPQPPAPAYQQYLYGVPRVDLMSMIRERDLEDGRLNGSELGHYTNSQLLYLPTQPRRWTPYGFPPIERALIPVMTGLSKQGYQLDYFKEGCYDDQTEILTREGWKLFAKLTDTDEVATRSTGGAFEWEKPTARLCYPYDGNLVEFSNKSVDLLVTPGHRMLVKPLRPRPGTSHPDWHVRLAKYFTDNPAAQYVVPATSTWVGETPEVFELPAVEADRRHPAHERAAQWLVAFLTREWTPSAEVLTAAKAEGISEKALQGARALLGVTSRRTGVPGGGCRWETSAPTKELLPQSGPYTRIPGFRAPMRAFCSFLGVYLAEGWVRADRDDIIVAQRPTSRHLAEIRQILEGTGLTWTYDERNAKFTTSHKALATWLRENGGHRAWGKRVPDGFKELSPELLSALLRGMMIGDGHWGPQGQRYYSTTSLQLADDVQEIFQKTGADAWIRVTDPDPNTPGTFGASKHRMYVVRERMQSVHGLPAPTEREYHGDVHCVTVPNGIVYIRRNGRAVWCGNTVPAVYISPGGDLSPNQIRELQDALNAVAGDTAFHHKVIVLPSGSHTEPQRPTPLADTFDEIVMTQVCSAFGVQPMQIGISPRASAMTSPGAQNQMAKQASGTQDMTTLQPTLLFLTGIMNTIIQDVCGQQDMRFVFDGMQEEEDEETTTNLIVNQVTHALITIDEARDKLGLQPYGLPQSSDPGFLTPTGFMFLDAALNPQPPAPFGAPPPEGGAPAQQNGQKPPNQPPGAQQKPAQQGAQQQAKPQQNGQQKPAQSSSTPGHAQAAAANSTAQSADQGGMKKAAKAAGPDPEDTVPADQQQQPVPEQDPEWETLSQDALEAYVTAKIAGVVTSAFLGSVTLLGAVEAIVGLLAKAYIGIMAKASAKAASEIAGVTKLTEEAIFGLAKQRAETQRGFASIMVNDAMDEGAQGATEPPAWIGNRAGLYSQSLAGAGNQAYGETVKANQPEHTIVWELGEAEHCPKCIARDGHEYTFDTLPGFPGDGGFGELCDGGPLCNCSLVYKDGDKVLDTLGNTQRPWAIGYYAQQKREIEARRQQMQTEREQFVGALPNQVGRDDTSVQSRATSRDQMRQQLASLANQRIRNTGGYGGVSVEPSDIPASLIASLIPQYGPIPADVPITDVMNAVESMFAGKFAAADVTRTSFGSLILGAVGDTVSGWHRAVTSEMEACARHLEKGREAGSWEPRKIFHSDVAVLATLVMSGATRADAVKQALETRRYVNLDGQVFEPDDDTEPADDGTPQTGGATGDAAGGGGYVKLPHDADGIYHDRYDLNPAHKAASDPGDPNPVEAEHVYNQMLANYPPKAIGWIKDARWIGPMAVDPDRVDTEDEDSWAASHEPARIKHFVKDMKKGKDIKPGVCVQEPGQSTVKVIDGHHRFLAARQADKPYMAYVGFVDKDSGPWDETHSFQFHQGASPQNKAAGTPGLTKRSGMVSIDVPDGLIPKVPGGVDDVQHITLAYLGSNVSDGTLDDVLRTAKHVAANTKPFTIAAGGVDSFPASDGSDGKVPAYVPVDKTDDLSALREPFARYHASEHQGFTPHITLAYLNEGDPLPDPVDPVTIPVDAICVHLGGNLHARVPLGYDGKSPILVKSAETGELSSIHRPLGTHGLWGDKLAQLPAYIQNIAHAMIKDGHDESGAIQLAIGAVKRWAAGEGKVTPEVQAAAAKAVAEWEKLKAEHGKTKSEGSGA